MTSWPHPGEVFVTVEVPVEKYLEPMKILFSPTLVPPLQAAAASRRTRGLATFLFFSTIPGHVDTYIIDRQMR